MLIEPFLAHAANTPDEIALQDDSGTYTYGQLARAATGLSQLLAAKTTKPTVALMLPSGAGFVTSFYAVLLAGKTIVPVNFLLGEKETAHVLSDSGVDTVLTISALAGKLQNSGLNVMDLTQLPKPPEGGAVQIPVPPKKSPDDLAVLMYTSGTSGLPKGVELTFGNLQSNVDACIERAQFKSNHIFLGVIPLFHAFGMIAMMLAPVQLGARIIYMARFNAVATLNAIRQHNVSLLFAVPSMYAAIAHLKSAKAEDFKSIYFMISGGEPLPATLREGFFQRYNVPIYEGYGLTETSPVISLNVPHSNRAGSVGKLVQGASARIVDDNGSNVPAGQSGEIWVAGPMVMKGYHNLPEATAAVLTAEREFKTGDIGRFDEDGFLYITGRKKELIIVAGEKASPREIEDILLRHPDVADAAVVGKKDRSRGEVVVGFIIAKEGADVKPEVLRDFCREQGLAQWKIPREIFLEKDLPRSPTGKVLKRVLAERVNQVSES